MDKEKASDRMGNGREADTVEVVAVIVAHDVGRSRALSKEERGLLANTLDDMLDAIALEDAIANAPRSKPENESRVLRMGHPAGKMVRQLVFWEGKGQAEDYAIHKVGREWRTSDARLTERQLRTATRVLKEHGLLETWGGYRPSDRRQTVFYRLNLWETLRVAFASEITTLAERLEHERRTKQRAKLEERLAKFKATLDDLELRFTEAPLEPEEDWHDEYAPDLTDEDAPTEATAADPEWLPEEFGMEDPDTDDTLSDYPGQNVSLPLTKRQPTPDTLHPLQKSNDRRERHVVTTTSSFNNSEVVVPTALSRRTPRPDFEDDEGQVATSAPTLQDSPSSGMAEKVAVLPTSVQTTTPKPEAVRTLLEPGGELHDLVDDAVGYGEQGVELLARHVARRLGGDAAGYVESVKASLLEIWKSESGVAA